MSGNYLDFNDLVVVDPSLVTITDSFLLCGGQVCMRVCVCVWGAGTHEGVCVHLRVGGRYA